MKLLLLLILGLTLVHAFVPFALAEEDNSLPDADTYENIPLQDEYRVIAPEDNAEHDEDNDQPEDHDDGMKYDLTLDDENEPAEVTDTSEVVEVNNPELAEEEKSSPFWGYRRRVVRRSFYRRRFYRRRYYRRRSYRRRYYRRRSYRRRYYRRRSYRRRYYRRRSYRRRSTA